MNDNLYNCTLKRDYFLVKYFIEKGADEFDWAMVYAAENNIMDLVQLMINIGVYTDDLNKALPHAALNNHLEMVQFLIEKGADNFNEAMRYAAHNNHLRMVQFMINKGANYDLLTDNQKTDLQIYQQKIDNLNHSN